MAADGVWRRRPWLPWLLWLTATLAAVIPASVLDLQISQEHASPDCGWCAALERFGELPGYGSASLAALAMLLMSPCWLDPSSAFQSFCTRHDARGSAAADRLRRNTWGGRSGADALSTGRQGARVAEGCGGRANGVGVRCRAISVVGAELGRAWRCVQWQWQNDNSVERAS